MIKLSEQDKLNIVSYYSSGYSIKETAKIFNLYYERTRRILKSYNVVRSKRKYTFDKYFFSRDNIESFYWAGFIAADGCLLDGRNRKILTISLATKDRQHLKLFKQSIKFNGIIQEVSNKGFYSCRVSIESHDIFNDLARFNVVPRKSLIYTFPKWLTNHPLVNHFMRGYNDGDGSFFTTGKGRQQLIFSLRGTESFLITYRDVLIKNCKYNLNTNAPKLSNGIFVLKYGGSRVSAAIRDFLYKNSTPTIRLNRKYDLSYDKMFIDMPENFNHKSIIGINTKNNTILKFKSMVSASKQGFCPNSISKCCRGIHKTHSGYLWRYA